MGKTLATGALAELAKDAVIGEELDAIFGMPAGDIDLSNPDEETVVPEPKVVEEPVEEEKEDEEEEEKDETEVTSPVAPVIVTVDPNEALVNALRLAFPAQQIQAPLAPVKQMTQEEIDVALNVWKATPEWIAKFENPETRVTALEEQSRGIARQAATMSNVLLQEREQAQQAQLAPLLQAQQQATVKEWRDDFDSAYPQLAKPEFTPILKLVTDNLKAQNFVPKDRAHAFETIAAATASLLSGVNPTFKLEAPKSRTPTKTTMPKLPTTTAGGGGGAGGKPKTPTGSTGNRSKGVEVFD